MNDRERLDAIKAGLCCEDARELEAIARRALDRAEKAEAEVEMMRTGIERAIATAVDNDAAGILSDVLVAGTALRGTESNGEPPADNGGR